MYTGGTDIQDAYGKLKAATLIQPERYMMYTATNMARQLRYMVQRMRGAGHQLRI